MKESYRDYHFVKKFFFLLSIKGCCFNKIKQCFLPHIMSPQKNYKFMKHTYPLCLWLVTTTLAVMYEFLNIPLDGYEAGECSLDIYIYTGKARVPSIGIYTAQC